MSDGVAIPAWLLVVMAALAVWALYEHAVAPALRFLDVGLRMLLMRHLVEENEGIYLAREKELPLLRYYANSIAHLLE